MNGLIILSILVSGPMHGYGLKQAAGLILGQESMHSNLVYPLLRRFVSEGWVKQKSAPGERGQTRKLYTLTDLGRRTLIERLGKYSEQDARSPEAFLVRVGLFGVLSPEVRERILNMRETVLRTRDERLARLQGGMDLGVYGGDIVCHLRQEIAAELRWIRHLHRLREHRKEDHHESSYSRHDSAYSPLVCGWRISSDVRRTATGAEYGRDAPRPYGRDSHLVCGTEGHRKPPRACPPGDG